MILITRRIYFVSYLLPPPPPLLPSTPTGAHNARFQREENKRDVQRDRERERELSRYVVGRLNAPLCVALRPARRHLGKLRETKEERAAWAERVHRAKTLPKPNTPARHRLHPPPPPPPTIVRPDSEPRDQFIKIETGNILPHHPPPLPKIRKEK